MIPEPNEMIAPPATENLRRLSDRLASDAKCSPLLASLRQLRATAKRIAAGRPLTQSEIATLVAQGNEAEDWQRVRLLSPEGEGDLSSIRGNRFAGDVAFTAPAGTLSDASGRIWNRGLRNSSIRDCWLGQACIENVERLEGYVVEDGALLAHIALMTCGKQQGFGLGLILHPGDETGSRSLWLWDGLDLQACAWSLGLVPKEQLAMKNKVAQAFAGAVSDFGYVGKGAHILATRIVEDTWVGPGSRIRGATLVKGCALLSSEGHPCHIGEDARVVDSMLQAGSEVEGGGSVKRSLLLEASGVGESGKVAESVLGPNTHVEKGEITASLVGPFVGFHHQSLLIAALWPEGRGNVAYGANVGSNHTGKKPDQEIRPGEGMFFGLGSTVKFPADFSDAPYSLIASGATTLPQRVGYPFSLIMPPTFAPAPSVDIQGLNEIRPGFMWSDNLYALARNSFKCLDRDKTQNHFYHPRPLAGGKVTDAFFCGRLFDADIAHKVASAYRHLRSYAQASSQAQGSSQAQAHGETVKLAGSEAQGAGQVANQGVASQGAAPQGVQATGGALILPKDLPGLGKNVMRSDDLRKACQTYEDYLWLYLMRWSVEPVLWNDPVLFVKKCGQALQALDLADLLRSGRGHLDATAATEQGADAGLQTRMIQANGHSSAQPIQLMQDAEFRNAWHRMLLERSSVIGQLPLRAAHSLNRDHRRGSTIFADYADFHPNSSEDGVLLKLRKATDELFALLEKWK